MQPLYIVPMLIELTASTLLVLATVLLHGVGLGVMGKFLSAEIEEETREHLPPLSLRALVFTCGVVLGLTILHGLEIWGYAFFYLSVGALHDLKKAVYLSTIAYGTVGFDDEGLRQSWEMVVAIEGINGVILLGWSTAFFVTIITRLGRRRS
ncbi:MAG: hypothetical protein PW790_03965 [Parvibaculaceae bacterium]|nr:hypothetical protein [Parvibaculaceae bacterium]